MSESPKEYPVRTGKVTVEEVLEDYQQNGTQHGNDIDLLMQSMMLIEAGHYQEAMQLALKVLPPSSGVDELPETVDRPTAQAAFLAANERARPLFEQAALDIEGKIEGSDTMATYLMATENLKRNPNW